jgi:hypothetical protein
MKTLIILVAALMSCSAWAETEHEALCYKETVNEKGWTSAVAVPCAPGKQKTVEQLQRDEEDAQKRKCGKDFMAIRIGMKIKRLEECHGATYVTERVSKDGVIKIYQTMFDMVEVKNGRIVSYTKRRF